MIDALRFGALIDLSGLIPLDDREPKRPDTRHTSGEVCGEAGSTASA